MKILRVLFVFVFISIVLYQTGFSKDLMSRTHDFGITAGLWFSGDISVARFGVWREKDAGLLLRVFYDEYIVEKLAVGAYINFSPVSSPALDQGATMFEIGGSFKPRFPLGGGKAILKPGLNIGYRMFSSSADILDKIDALGLNVSVEVQFATDAGIVPFAEVGFLSQPAGGNPISDITFAPIVYLGGGIAF